MSHYDQFARFYDAIMDDRPDAVSVLNDVIVRHGPKPRSVLELGCGTGTVLNGLQGDFERTGIDLSTGMLNIAQRKYPGCRFVHGDIARFELAERFDFVYCVFDTINHLPRFADWESTFERARSHLEAGGYFVFDMITVQRIHILSALPTLEQELPGGTTVEMDLEPAGRDAVAWYITVQEPADDGTVQVYEDTVTERAYPTSRVEAALTRYFEVLECFDSSGQPPIEASDRVYYVCRAR